MGQTGLFFPPMSISVPLCSQSLSMSPTTLSGVECLYCNGSVCSVIISLPAVYFCSGKQVWSILLTKGIQVLVTLGRVPIEQGTMGGLRHTCENLAEGTLRPPGTRRKQSGHCQPLPWYWEQVSAGCMLSGLCVALVQAVYPFPETGCTLNKRG